jgi:hypothetical protein
MDSTEPDDLGRRRPVTIARSGRVPFRHAVITPRCASCSMVGIVRLGGATPVMPRRFAEAEILQPLGISSRDRY